MNENTIKELKKDFNEVEVNTLFTYISNLKSQKKKTGEPTYPWASYLKDDQIVNLFKQAKSLGLVLDGDSVTIENKGTVKLNFNYQAYKNLVIHIYPEAMFDMQIIYKGDSFRSKKENGKVIYSHGLDGHLLPNKEIVGCYCIIKTKTGEFIEIMTSQEIYKCKSKATTNFIWNEWESEMSLKTVIKRACKRHFKDIVKEIDKLDNEDYDLTPQEEVKESKPVQAFKQMLSKKDLPNKEEIIDVFSSLTVAEQRDYYQKIKAM